MSTLKIRLEYTGDELVITGCPSEHNINITVSKFIDFDETIYSGVITVGNQPPIKIQNAEIIESVKMYISGKLTFAKQLKQCLGFIPYYTKTESGIKSYISEDVFESINKNIVFTDLFDIQIPKAFTKYMKIRDIYWIDYDIRLIVALWDATEVIHEALAKLHTPATYTINDMVTYYVLGMDALFDGKPRFISGDTLYLDTMDNRMQNGILFPQLYEFKVPRVKAHLPLQLARYLPEYQKICDTMNDFSNKSYLYRIAVDAFIQDVSTNKD